MLFDKADEIRLAAILDVARHDRDKGIEFSSLKTETTLWLADNLKHAIKELEHLRKKHPLNIDYVTVQSAKKLLMAKFGMSDHAAYHFIRKTAMDNHQTKVEVAKKIIEEKGKVYEKPTSLLSDS